MSARYIRKKKDIKEEDLIPQLPKPEELKPFPTTESVYFRGHESSIRSLCVDPQGKYLISADSAGYVMFWDIETTKIVKRINVSDDILHVVFNPVLNLLTVVCKETLYFVLPPYLDKKTKTEVMSLIDTKVKPIMTNIISEYDNEGAEAPKFKWCLPDEEINEATHGILFSLKWIDGTLMNIVWHNKGDYFATLSKNTLGKTQVLIHSLSKLTFQTPFSKVRGTINAIIFHTNKPYFIVATNSNIFIYNLQKQEMIRKFVSNLNTITHLNVHKDGENIICGTKDGKIAWFQLDLSEKPYKIMEFHNDKIKSLSFHSNYPLFCSASRNGKILIYHNTVYDDLIQDPLIVPLKVLKPSTSEDQSLNCVAFHPKHPWIFSCGDDAVIRLWN